MINHSFDVELPVECDDEYWVLTDHPNPEKPHKKCVVFKQPPGKPSKITYFNCFLRLNQILAFALRTIVRSFTWPVKLICTVLVY